MPPLMTEKVAPSQFATRPASNSPSCGPPDEKHHVDAGHAAAQPIRRLELPDDVANDHADRVARADERKAGERHPERP